MKRGEWPASAGSRVPRDEALRTDAAVGKHNKGAVVEKHWCLAWERHLRADVDPSSRVDHVDALLRDERDQTAVRRPVDDLLGRCPWDLGRERGRAVRMGAQIADNE